MIRIGTSGFSYDDWRGPFYPEKISNRDMLAYYVGQFNTVEINSSYYAIPSAKAFASMAIRTPDMFDFVVKAHKDMTHAEETGRDVFERFVEAIDPLREAGKLGCVLAQFPWGFKCTPENSDRLREFKTMIRELPTVVEFRNSGWVNQNTFDLLRELDLGFCSVDEPPLKGLMPRIAVATSDIGYVRFHGRNAAKWWQHAESHERYDYMYSEDELAQWLPKIADLNSATNKTYLFFNNHYHAQSVNSARIIADMLGLDSHPGSVVQKDASYTFEF